MRRIERTGQFRRDYKREEKDRHSRTLDHDFLVVLTALVVDGPLAARHHDHALTGDWKDHRDCHIRPDLVLIYQSRITTLCGWCVSARMPHSVREAFGAQPTRPVDA